MAGSQKQNLELSGSYLRLAGKFQLALFQPHLEVSSRHMYSIYVHSQLSGVSVITYQTSLTIEIFTSDRIFI